MASLKSTEERLSALEEKVDRLLKILLLDPAERIQARLEANPKVPAAVRVARLRANAALAREAKAAKAQAHKQMPASKRKK